jgi:hypothetical protein
MEQALIDMADALNTLVVIAWFYLIGKIISRLTK